MKSRRPAGTHPRILFENRQLVRSEKLCESGGESPPRPEAEGDRDSETKVENGKEEPGAGLPPAGVFQEGTGQPVSLPRQKWVSDQGKC
jgi:hypothetical protein